MKSIKSILTAIRFLTILPIPGGDEIISDEEIGRSTAFFPLTGIFLGSILFLVNIFLSRFFAESVANIFIIASALILSRGLHIDGFADVIDGFFGGKTKTDRLRIMKDSAIGTFGTCGIFLLLMSKVALLNNLSPHVKALSLFIVPMGGRLSIVFMSYISTYVEGRCGIGKPFTEYTKEREFWIATLTAVISSVIFIGKYGIILIFLILAFCVILKGLSNKMIGGITGDVLGTASEVSELIVLISILLLDANTDWIGSSLPI